jgi:truncated hemoglobin YjbI
VNSKFAYGWDMFSSPTAVYTPPQTNTNFPSAPVMTNRDNDSISLEWPEVENAKGYTLRYRRENDMTWETIDAVIPSNAARKKNLPTEHKFCFAVRPIVDNEMWEFSPSSAPYSVQELSKARLHHSSCGYTTTNGRLEYLTARGITSSQDKKRISESLSADPNMECPLYYWQLYSIMGTERILELVTTFYELVYADTQEPWFRTAFARLSEKEHHIQTQAAYWIDAMGGGKYYHGGEYRLNFHHTHNAESVMTARGATRWMYHMRCALTQHAIALNNLDRRIIPALLDFLKVKMFKYASQHGWDFDGSDFEPVVVGGQNEAK